MNSKKKLKQTLLEFNEPDFLDSPDPIEEDDNIIGNSSANLPIQRSNYLHFPLLSCSMQEEASWPKIA